MSDIENINDFDFEGTFLGLIEKNETHDAGIALFEKRLKKVETELTEQFSTIKGGFSSDIAEGVENELNEEWRYHDEVAIVSGRIYLVEPEYEFIAPKNWGESNIDDEGRVYFFVENISLKSHGVEVIPQFEEDHESASGVRVGYAFSDPNDDFARPLITAFVGELSKHFYEYPTPEEAGAKLTREWPEQLAVINILMKPSIDLGLPSRMGMLARKLQEDLQASPEFRTLAEIYINGRIALDQNLPYIATVKDYISYFDGEDITADDAYKHWRHVDMSEPMTLSLFDPKVNFFSHKDGSYHAYIVGATYNQEDGDEPEYVSLAAQDIEMFRGTRSYRSIAERALLGLDMLEAKADREKSEGLNIIRISDKAIEINPDIKTGSELIEEFRQPELIKKIEAFLQDLKDIAGEIKLARRTVYNTVDDAAEASVQFIVERIKPRFNRDGVSLGSYILELSGKNAKRPRPDRSIPRTPENSHISIVGVNPEDPWVPTQDGDSFLGTPVDVRPLTYESYDAQGEVVGYTISPTMFVEIEGERAVSFEWCGVDIETVSVDRRVPVALDGTVTIKSKAYEDFVAMKQAFKTLSTSLRGHEVVKQLKIIQQGLASELPSRLIYFKDVEKIQKLGETVGQMIQNGEDVAPVIDTLDVMFVHRKLSIVGDVYALNDSVVELDDVLDSDHPLSGSVADIRADILEGRLTLTFDSNDGPIYVPVDSISQMRF